MTEKCVTGALAVILFLASAAGAQKTTLEPIWTGSWAAAPVAAPPNDTPIGSGGVTFRDIVHLSLGGRAIRLRLSNEFGAVPLTIASVHVALSAGAGATRPGSDHAVTFNKAASVAIPAGAVAISDPVAMPVDQFADLAVSIFVPSQPSATLTLHTLAVSTNYVAPGDDTAAESMPDATKITSWHLMDGIDVDAGPGAYSVVVLGASISDGYHSTLDKNNRWPDDLARRLAANPATAHIGVLNKGIGGNRLLHDTTGPSALARFDRDVLSQPGGKYVIVSMGTNDIGRAFFPRQPGEAPVTAEQMEWALQQIVARAHARGVKVIVATLTPFAGADYYSEPGEQMLQAVNSYVRTSGIFDGVVDFERVTRDPAHPAAYLPVYDSGDHLHPNDSGYKAMAEAVDLSLFTP